MTFEIDTSIGTAAEFKYCSLNDDSCDGGVSGNVLNGSGNSEVWDTCNDLEYAGYDDWRVPSRDELVSLVQCDDGPLNYPSRTWCGNGNYAPPTIDTTLFPNCPSTRFWTSAAYGGGSAHSWLVYFATGGVGNKGFALSVFCVR